MVKVGIIGATGYAGAELVRILLNHKEAQIEWFGSRSYIDENYADIYRNFFELVDADCLGDNMDELACFPRGCDFHGNTTGISGRCAE